MNKRISFKLGRLKPFFILYTALHTIVKNQPVPPTVTISNVICQRIYCFYFILFLERQTDNLRKAMSNSNLGGTRINSFNENFLNECDQDANSVLTELDKGKHFDFQT